MKAGELRHRGTLQSPTVTADAQGGSVTTWSKFAERVPIRVIEQGSRELWNAQQAQPEITCLVQMRWMRGVTTGMRWIWHDGDTDRILNVLGPPMNPDGRHEEMILTCKEPK